MHGHPVQGIKGAKVKKPENGKSRLSSRPGERIAQLSAEYIELRNRAQLAKAEAAEIALLEKKGTLISRELACAQLAYLLVCFRRRVLLSPAAIARGLASLDLLQAGKEHATQDLIREEMYAMLSELADLPMKVTNENWLEELAADSKGDGESPQVQMAPGEAKVTAQKAEARRKRKVETQRQRRAEGSSS